ncbi:MAG: diguanylate cyclase [Burkholderiales bacterium]|nr:diguanylate cyclase [Burkholderiales bacterium]
MAKTLRVLIVDDSADDAELLVNALRHSGYELAWAVTDTAESMRAALARQDWDVITSDHAMPQFSAPAALSLAKEMRPDLPFIIVSGEIDLDLAVSLLRAGAQDYIQKRNLAEVVPAIERGMRAAQARRDRAAARRALEKSEIRYRRIFEAAKDGILILEAETGRIIDANPFLMDMLGYSKQEFLHKTLWELCAPAETEAVKAAVAALQGNGYAHYEDLPLETSDGRRLDAEFVGSVYLADNTKLIQCNIRNLEQFEDFHELPNRMLFQHRLGQAISLAKRNRYKLSLLYLDLDNFEIVNDTLGRGAGDEILMGAANRILQRVRVSDTVGRIKKGELAVLLPRIENPEDAATVAKKIIDALFASFQLSGDKQQEVRIGANIGIAIFPTDGPDTDALLKVANSASHKAKQLGSSYSFRAT